LAVVAATAIPLKADSGGGELAELIRLNWRAKQMTSMPRHWHDRREHALLGSIRWDLHDNK
jgi:hypothetical protein